jgi:cyanate permease
MRTTAAYFKTERLLPRAGFVGMLFMRTDETAGSSALAGFGMTSLIIFLMILMGRGNVI